MLLKNINYYDCEKRDFTCGNILIQNGRYEKISTNDLNCDEGYDLSGKYMISAYVNSHTHVAMSLFRNYADDMELMTWLKDKIWPLEDKLLPNDIYIGAKLSIMEMIKSGTTTINDMYFIMGEVARASYELGTRGIFSNGLMDSVGSFEENFKKTTDLFEKLNYKNQTPGVSPHAIYTLSEYGLKKSKEFSDKNNLIYHIHAAESRDEIDFSKEKYNMTPIEYLDSIGVLDEKTVLAHCVHLNDNDRAIIADRKSHVAINLSSNLKLASGVPDIKKMIDASINVCIGTDGPASNNIQSILREMQLISKVTKGINYDSTLLKPSTILEMATINGARALGYSDLGIIKEGYLADFIVYDLDSIHNAPLLNPLNAIMYSAKDEDLYMTVSNGEILYMDGKFLNTDEKEVIREANRAIKELIRR